MTAADAMFVTALILGMVGAVMIWITDGESDARSRGYRVSTKDILRVVSIGSISCFIAAQWLKTTS